MLFLGSYLPLLNNAIRAPGDRVYLGFEEYPIDVLWAVDIMRQGYNGHWGVALQFSSTLPETRGFIKLEYLLLGKISRTFGIDLVTTLHIARIFVSVVYVMFIIRIIGSLFAKRETRIAAYLFTLFGTSITLGLSAAHDAGVFQRITDASLHHIFGGFLSWVSLWSLSLFIEKRDAKAYYIALISGFFASLVYAPAMMLVLLGLPIFLVVTRGRGFKEITLYAVIVALPMFYVRYVTGTLWSPHHFTNNETLNPFAVSFKHYPFAMGMTYLLSFLTIPTVLTSKRPLFLLILPWLVVHPIGEYVISPLFGINPVRFFLTPYFIGFGLLSALVIDKMRHGIWAWLVVCVVLASGWNSYKASFYASRVTFGLDNTFSFGYPKKDLVAAMEWLRTNTSEYDRVLTSLYAGNLVPAFSGNRVVTSWWHRLANPPGFYPLAVAVESFYGGAMTNQDGLKFLERYGIGYILADRRLTYSFLEPMFTRGSSIVYKVTK